MNSTVWTVGISTRPLETFLALLEHHRIETVADVRRFPASRRQPQYAQGSLGSALTEDGIAYHWIAALGGRRRPRPDSPNTAWRNLQFRGYADYIASKEFEEGVHELFEAAVQLRTTMMCAGAVRWHCHRALIADVLCMRVVYAGHRRRAYN
jgi:uncharacterized protein (DUF488 family)